MALRDIKFSKSYRTLHGDVVRDFYLPVLKEAILYKRAVGYFNSQALYDISDGIMHLAKNNGKMQLIVSPQLEKEDIEAIIEGYEARENIVIKAITRALSEPSTPIEKTKLNLLANLIAESVLDIKIALKVDRKSTGIFHEKMGIVEDCEGNKIAFSGSMNETGAGLYNNYETIDIFTDWSCDDNHERVLDKEGAFDSLWNNTDPAIDTFEFPKEAKEWLGKHKEKTTREIIDMGEFLPVHKKIEERPENCFIVPETVSFFKYQEDAIENWMKQESCGIFDMATGTGKTYTALGALCALSKKLNHRLVTVIVCPYQHLVEQWVEDINKFGVKPIICYSRYDWKETVRKAVRNFNLEVVDRFCIITTNASLVANSYHLLHELQKVKENMCLVVDEAHNFGSKRQIECMVPEFKYRLALSATLDRHHDEEGTQCLYDYFGAKCITYTLQEAIEQNKLTRYYYYPIPVVLRSNELDEYVELTEKIVDILRKFPKKKKNEIPSSVETLLIERSRIIAGAQNKLDALREISKEWKDKTNLLFYCGATKVQNEDEDTIKEADDYELRQIDATTKILHDELGMIVTQFTAAEDSKQREIIKSEFKERRIQGLVAIKCLDEGMNIPGIETAFILASSTNPKEYIQRRGRVLRKAPGKEYATIYDFVVIPRDFDEEVSEYSKQAELSLVRREMERMEDFQVLSENPSSTTKLMNALKSKYKVYQIGEYYGRI